MAEWPSSSNSTRESSVTTRESYSTTRELYTTTEESISSENNEISTQSECIISTVICYINDGETYKAIEMLKSFEAELADNHLALWDIRNLLGNAYSHLHDYETALSYYQENIHLSRNNLVDKLREMISLANIGNIYKTTGQFDLAIYYYKDLAEIDKTTKINFFRKEAFICLGDTYFAKSQYLMKNNHNQLTEEVKLNMHNAIRSYYRGLEILNSALESMNIYHQIAEIWYHLKDYNLCITMNEKILELVQISGNTNNELEICRHLGDLCAITCHYDQSIVYYHKALHITTTLDMTREKARLIFDLGNIYILQGNLTLAVNYHSEHVKIAELMNDAERILLALSTLSFLLKTVGKYNEAKFYAGAQYAKAKELNNLREMQRAIKFIHKISRNEADQRKKVVPKRRYRQRQLL